MIKNIAFAALVVLTLSATSAFAQGYGPGKGNGYGQGMRQANCQGYRMMSAAGPNYGAGYGRGGYCPAWSQNQPAATQQAPQAPPAATR